MFLTRRPGVCGSFTYANCGVKDISKAIEDLDEWPCMRIRVTKGTWHELFARALINEHTKLY